MGLFHELLGHGSSGICSSSINFGSWAMETQQGKSLQMDEATAPRNKSRNNQSLAPPGKNGFVELIRIWKCFDISS